MYTLALCIPAYNAAWSLPDLFDSVNRQEIPFNEILIYDDCSTDNTYQVATEFGATVIKGDINRGCSHAKNILAQKASSDWLFFLDSDDELLPGFSKTISTLIQREDNVDMVLLGYRYVDKKTGEIKHEPNYNKDALLSDSIRFMIENKVVNSSIVKRKSFLSIGGFDTDPEILYAEDRAYSIKTALKGFVYDIEPTVCFQINFYSSSMSASSAGRWLNAILSLMKKVYKLTGNKYSDAICNQLFLNAVWAAKFNCWSITKQCLVFAKTIQPGMKPKTSKIFQLGYVVWPYGAFVARELLFRFRHKIQTIKTQY